MTSTRAEEGASSQDFACEHATDKQSRGDSLATRSKISANPIGDDATTPSNHTAPSNVVAVDCGNSAVNQVFGTIELCESILSHLRPIDILCVRQLSRHFAAVVDNSHLLKRIAFLSPMREAADGDPVIRDPDYAYFSEHNCRAYDAPGIIHPVHRNPFVFKGVNTSWCHGALGFRAAFEAYIMNNTRHAVIEEMFLTNPPVREMDVFLGDWELHNPNGPTGCIWGHRLHLSHVLGWCFHDPVGEMVNSDGLRVKDLVALLRRKLSMANADGERRFTMEDGMVVLLAPVEVVGTDTDTNLPGSGQLSYDWM